MSLYKINLPSSTLPSSSSFLSCLSLRFFLLLAPISNFPVCLPNTISVLSYYLLNQTINNQSIRQRPPIVFYIY